MNQKSALVIAPHPDDELFATPIIRELQRLGYSIEIASFYLNAKRSDEFKSSSSRLKCSCLHVNGIYIDGKYHENAKMLKKSLEQLYDAGYDKIIIPLLEGGHQDHDTIAAILSRIMISDARHSDTIYYSTYFSAFRSLYFTHRSRSPRNYSGFRRANIFSNGIELARILSLWITCYRSQTKTWILLLPALVIRVFANRFYGFMLENKSISNNFNDMLESISTLSPDEVPLYEFHARVSYAEWASNIADLND